MRIPLDRNSPTPLYRQICAFLEEQIESGSLVAQTRLPATRELAVSLGVGRLTVSNAYAELESKGLIYSVQGSGTFVAPLSSAFIPNKTDIPEGRLPAWQKTLVQSHWVPASFRQESLVYSAAHPDLISFAEGSGDAGLFPFDDFRQSFQKVFRTSGISALGYGEAAGFTPLRNTIAQILTSQGIPARPEQVIITSGSQQGLNWVIQSLLEPGDSVVVESPTHMGFLDFCQSYAVKTIEVPIDDQGMQIDRLQQVLLTNRPKLIYTVPNFQNPSGACLNAVRRRKLVEVANSNNIPILEDDFVGDLRYKGTAQPALKALDTNGNIIYVSTFSKILIPGLRLGYLMAAGPVFQKLLVMKQIQGQTTSNLMQQALNAYITLGRYQAGLRKARQVFGRRRMVMLAALAANMPQGTTWSVPNGGFYIWLKLPQGLSADDLFPFASARHVIFSPGSLFYPGGHTHDRLRLNFSLHPPPVIEEGIRRLGVAVRDFMAFS